MRNHGSHDSIGLGPNDAQARGAALPPPPWDLFIVGILLYEIAAIFYSEGESQFGNGRFAVRRLSFVLLMSAASMVSAESRFGSDSWKAYVEFDQMFIMKVGAERSLSRDWGIKGAVGLSLFGFTTIGYQVVGVYHITPPKDRFQWDIEFGLPVAYFNFLEGTVVDWSPYINGPFAGWAPGASLVWGLRFDRGSILGVKTGVLIPFEYQWDSGWSDRLHVIPEIAIQWMF